MKMTPQKIVSLILLLGFLGASYSFIMYFDGAGFMDPLTGFGGELLSLSTRNDLDIAADQNVANAIRELSSVTNEHLNSILIDLKFALGMIYAIGLAVILYPWLKKEGK